MNDLSAPRSGSFTPGEKPSVSIEQGADETENQSGAHRGGKN